MTDGQASFDLPVRSDVYLVSYVTLLGSEVDRARSVDLPIEEKQNGRTFQEIAATVDPKVYGVRPYKMLEGSATVCGVTVQLKPTLFEDGKRVFFGGTVMSVTEAMTFAEERSREDFRSRERFFNYNDEHVILTGNGLYLLRFNPLQDTIIYPF